MSRESLGTSALLPDLCKVFSRQAPISGSESTLKYTRKLSEPLPVRKTVLAQFYILS